VHGKVYNDLLKVKNAFGEPMLIEMRADGVPC
jgi:hypothetical protein